MSVQRLLEEIRDRHRPADRDPTFDTPCKWCRIISYPCPDRRAAVAALDELAKRDAEITQHLEAMAPLRCRWVAIGQPPCSEHPDSRGDTKQWCYACVNRMERAAIDAVLVSSPTPTEEQAPHHATQTVGETPIWQREGFAGAPTEEQQT